MPIHSNLNRQQHENVKQCSIRFLPNISNTTAKVRSVQKVGRFLFRRFASALKIIHENSDGICGEHPLALTAKHASQILHVGYSLAVWAVTVCSALGKTARHAAYGTPMERMHERQVNELAKWKSCESATCWFYGCVGNICTIFRN